MVRITNISKTLAGMLMIFGAVSASYAQSTTTPDNAPGNYDIYTKNGVQLTPEQKKAVDRYNSTFARYSRLSTAQKIELEVRQNNAQIKGIQAYSACLVALPSNAQASSISDCATRSQAAIAAEQEKILNNIP